MSFSAFERITKKPKAQLRVAELIGSLSYALDMTEGQPLGHCLRCCWIGTKIGETLDLSPTDLSDLYFTLLLKDVGCSSNAARICELFLADDISFKRDYKTIDIKKSAAMRFIFSKTGLKAKLGERIMALVHLAQQGTEIDRSLIETRCDRGAEISAKLRFSQAVQSGVRNLDEHWDGSGQPLGLSGTEIPIISNIALLAQVVDVFHQAGGREEAIQMAQARSDVWFNGDIVTAFMAMQSDQSFWDILESPDIETHIFSMPPAQTSTALDEDYLDEIAAAFSQVVDAKSPFTAEHSSRVAVLTELIAQEMDLSDAHRRWLSRAALLHDLGKLAVSNQVLDNTEKLTDEEWSQIKEHPLHSEKILERVEAFSDIAPIAGAHHERLDGKGYPYGLVADQLCIEVRILTVADVFDALTADRPYRKAMSTDAALAILYKGVDSAFDSKCVDALKAALATQ